MNNYNSKPQRPKFMTDKQKAQMKVELKHIYTESKPHLVEGAKFVGKVAVQPHKWKSKYNGLNKSSKDGVVTGLYLIGGGIFAFILIVCAISGVFR